MAASSDGLVELLVALCSGRAAGPSRRFAGKPAAMWLETAAPLHRRMSEPARAGLTT